VIQVHTFFVPLAHHTFDAACERLEAAREAIATRHPSLLGMTLTLLGAQGDEMQMDLRVAGHDRWRVQHNARLIAATMARRAGLPYKQVVWGAVASEPNRRNLTVEQGRQFSHAPRRAAAPGA